jgi:hypothetical protein
MGDASPTHSQDEVAYIYRQLRRTLRHGSHPAQLVAYSRPIIHLLAPASQYPGMSLEQRAFMAESALRAAIRRIGGDKAQALNIFLGIAPGYLNTTVEARRKAAAACLGIQPDTFRRPRHERLLLLQVAIEIYRKQAQSACEKGCA